VGSLIVYYVISRLLGSSLILDKEARSYFYAINTNTAVTNTSSCLFSACENDVVVASLCNEFNVGSCTGDTYLRIVDSKGIEVASNDDSCGACSKISFIIPSFGCDKFYIHQGCYGNEACGGQVSITSVSPSGQPTSRPSGQPSQQPSRPTRVPTFNPSQRPSHPPSYFPTLYPSAPPSMKPTAFYCPISYSAFVLPDSSFGCYKLAVSLQNRSAASMECNSDSNGWLATLDTSDKAQVIPNSLGLMMDTYIGLRKTSVCVLSGCLEKLSWDTY